MNQAIRMSKREANATKGQADQIGIIMHMMVTTRDLCSNQMQKTITQVKEAISLAPVTHLPDQSDQIHYKADSN